MLANQNENEWPGPIWRGPLPSFGAKPYVPPRLDCVVPPDWTVFRMEEQVEPSNDSLATSSPCVGVLPSK